MLTKAQQEAKIITNKDLIKSRPLSKSWTKAAGLLRRKHKELEKHVKQVRKEWNSRSSK